ncbi:RsfA family transcriptional regulator [Bacillaceae bacterium Marseille-Q3522]|nr:RsfA family transcriptional regulator [Bacillaceae bacterium Marseille-Q3522]
MMKVRQDAWTEENDLLLAETVLRHVREGSTQLNAFEEVGDKLNRTSAACGFRWNAVVRHQYEKALSLAKKQRKQRQRILGKEQGGKKKLLYTPPIPNQKELESLVAPQAIEQANTTDMSEAAETNHMITPVYTATELTLTDVISYLQSLNRSHFQMDILKNENERLKREIASLKGEKEKLEEKVQKLEKNSETVKEDYETLMKIMNRARKLVLVEEEERPATTFKMDRNGNLEKLAE